MSSPYSPSSSTPVAPSWPRPKTAERMPAPMLSALASPARAAGWWALTWGPAAGRRRDPRLGRTCGDMLAAQRDVRTAGVRARAPRAAAARPVIDDASRATPLGALIIEFPHVSALSPFHTMPAA